jgi:thiol-disulfide isomerase/thioredoxin
LILLGFALVAGSVTGEGPRGLTAVRKELDEVPGGEGLSGQRALALGAEILEMAQMADSNKAFFEAMTVMADLCGMAPKASARQVRGQALGLLGERFIDSVRWKVLARERFQPPLERLPQDHWSEEMAAYDQLLDDLRKISPNQRVQAEWLYSKALLRLHVNQRWDWLSEDERKKAIALLEDIVRQVGPLHVPGARGEQPTTYAELATDGLYELRKLFFGAPAPPTSGTDLEGRPLDLMDYRGSVVVLDFWSTFCLPCLAMVPESRALLENLRGQPLVFLGVNADVDRDQGLRTAHRTGMTWRNFWDGSTGTSGPLATAWHVRGRPTVIVLDAMGRIRFKFTGQQATADGLEGAVRRLLDEFAAEQVGDNPPTGDLVS